MPFATRERALLFNNRSLDEGVKISGRLNINILKKTGVPVQTVHTGWNIGKVLGYDNILVLGGMITFTVKQKGRAKIASGQSKFPMASVNGFSTNERPSFKGTILSFNPFKHHLFVDQEGYAVKSATTATLAGTVVFVQGEIEYWKESEAPLPEGDLPSLVKFKK